MLNNILPRYIATEHSFNPNPIIRINYFDETPSYENWLKWDLGIVDTKRERIDSQRPQHFGTFARDYRQF